MNGQKQPSRWMVWLGLADNSFTRQKTVKFGDASAVNSGRGYGIISVLAFIVCYSACVFDADRRSNPLTLLGSKGLRFHAEQHP